MEDICVMKKIKLLTIAVCAAAIIALCGSTVTMVSAAQAPDFSAPSVVLADAGTGTVLFEHNGKEHRPIASMVKIMTLLLVFENAESGNISYDEKITVSEIAASMGGSQAFLDAHDEYLCNDLIKSIVVASANDSCVALAERIAGSVEGFVACMNEKAADLGMNDTNFVNCTGLPAPNQYSCAYDAAIMFSNLIKHERYFDYANVWMFDFHHPSGRDTVLTNTNKMIRSYEGCDGGKTGFTNEAMYCLSATAKRGDTRLIGVITGADTSKNRNAEMSKLFDFGFANYSTKQVIFAGQELAERLEVPSSKEKSTGIAPAADGFYLTERGAEKEISYVCEYDEIALPLAAGSKIGRIKAIADGVTVAESDLVTTGDLNKMTYFDIVGELVKGM